MKGIVLVSLVSLLSSAESLWLKNTNSGMTFKSTDEGSTQSSLYPADMSSALVQRSLTGDDYGFMQIVNANSNKCLTVTWDLASDGKRNGAPIIMWDCTDGARNQHWSTVEVNDSTDFQLINRHTGKCLTVSGGSKNAGAVIDSWECVAAIPDNQRWMWVG